MSRNRGAATLISLALCWASPAEARAEDKVRRPDSDSFQYFYLDVHKPLFVKRGPAGGESYRSRSLLGRQLQRFSARKPPGTFRVFVLGGSVAQLYDIDGERPTLKNALEALVPGTTVETLNMGMSGYDAARVAVTFDEALGYEPDLILVMSAVNEWGRPMLSPRQARHCAKPLLRRACEWMVLRQLPKGGVPAGKRRESYLKSVRGMLRRGKAHGVPVILATLPVSLRDMPPWGRLPLSNKTFFDAWMEFERGRWSEAARGFRKYLALVEGAEKEDDGPPSYDVRFGYYYLGRSLDKLGDIPGAKKNYVIAQNIYRPAPLMNETLRALSKEEGAVLADIERLFESVSPDGMIGRGLFEDDVHWDRRYDRLATLGVVKAARSLLRTKRQWDGGWIEKNEAAILGEARNSKFDEARSWNVFRFRMWEPLHSDDKLFSERVLALLETLRMSHPSVMADPKIMRRWLKEKLTGNIWMEDDAAKLGRWWPAMLAHVGELYRRVGRYRKAVLFFDEALRLKPGIPKVRLRKAISLISAGDKDAGKAELPAIAPGRGNAETRHWLEAYGL